MSPDFGFLRLTFEWHPTRCFKYFKLLLFSVFLPHVQEQRCSQSNNRHTVGTRDVVNLRVRLPQDSVAPRWHVRLQTGGFDLEMSVTVPGAPLVSVRRREEYLVFICVCAGNRGC